MGDLFERLTQLYLQTHHTYRSKIKTVWWCNNGELPEDVRNTKWDIIVVDAPAGWSDKYPCRMKSIYEAYNLSKNQKGVDIFVHDSQRKIETQYSNNFLNPNCELITEIIESEGSKFSGRKLSHYKTK